MAELRGERSIVIQASPQEVYEYVSDFPRHAEWNHQPTEIKKISDGPITVGTVFRTKERPPDNAPWIIRKLMLPLMWKIVRYKGYTEAEITAMETNRRLAWKASAPVHGGGYWLKAEYEILLEANDGVTEVTQRYRYMPQHRLSENITSESAAEQISLEVDANLVTLKHILESNPGGP